LLNMSGTSSTDFDAPQNMLPNSNEFKFHKWRFPDKLEMGERYYNSVASSTNIKVILNATTTNIEATENVSHITALNVSTLNNKHFNVTAKRYILACGGIENARLLLLSRNQIHTGLGNQNDLVGRFFMQHPHLEVGRLYTFDSSKFMEPFIHQIGVPGKPLQNKPPFLNNITPSPEAMNKHKMLNGSLTVNNIQTKFKRIPMVLDLMQRTFSTKQGQIYNVGIYARCEQAPNADSRVTLSPDKKDRFGLPVTRLDWRMTELDWYSIRQLGMLLAQNISSRKLGVMRLHPWANKYGHWPQDLIGGDHHMGTTRMHDDPKQGVVDRNCRVHGTDNLYIAGSSVYPTVGWANPTYTLIALAFRLAKHLRNTA